MQIKFSHKVFHLNSAVERAQYFESINNYLSAHSTELNVETVGISSQEELLMHLSNNPDFKIDPNGYDVERVQGWRYGEIGIWLSNYTAWKEFLNSDSDYCILMEDDILYEDNFIELMKKYIKELPAEWDVFFFGVPLSDFNRYRPENCDFGAKNICHAYQDYWLMCYVLSKSGAEKAIANIGESVSVPVDWYFLRQKSLFKSYAVKPTSKFGCSGAPIDTTIQKQERKALKIDS